MGKTLESDLSSLLTYYGESPDSADSSKPEDFFAMVVSFSSALQVRLEKRFLVLSSKLTAPQKCALDMHNIEHRPNAAKSNTLRSPVQPVIILSLTALPSERLTISYRPPSQWTPQRKIQTLLRHQMGVARSHARLVAVILTRLYAASKMEGVGLALL